MNLNTALMNNVKAVYGEAGARWLVELPRHLNALVERWNIQSLQPLDNLSYHFVARVKLASGLVAILKTAPKQAPLMAEAEWLQTHKKRVPIVLQVDRDLNAFLMEKCEPGVSLKSFVQKDDEKASRILAEVILDLQSVNAKHVTPYQHISEHISTYSYLHGHIDQEIIDHAKALFSELCKDRSQDIVLHGDLHHDNILQHDDSWYVIDPHGSIGHPCAEIGPMIFNPLDNFPGHLPVSRIIERRLQILADCLPFDLARIKDWAFCLALRSAAWDIEGFGKPHDRTLEIAKIIWRSKGF